jgi:hypothetical protein
VKLTVYQLEILPPAFGLCATDDFGALYFHAGLISSEANSAFRQRAFLAPWHRRLQESKRFTRPCASLAETIKPRREKGSRKNV